MSASPLHSTTLTGCLIRHDTVLHRNCPGSHAGPATDPDAHLHSPHPDRHIIFALTTE